MSRLFRVFVCLVLVIALALGPLLRAHATGGVVAGSTQLLPVVAGPAGAIVGLILIGLGIYALSESDDWDNLCDTIGNALTGTYVTYIDGNPYITMAQHGSEYYVDQQAVADVLAKAQQSGTINKRYIIDVEGLVDVRQSTLDYVTIPQDYKSFPWVNYYLFVPSITGGNDILYLCQSQPFISLDGKTASISPKSKYIAFKSDGTRTFSSYTLDVTNVTFNGRPYTTGALKYAPTSTLLDIRDLGLTLDDDQYKTWVQDPAISVQVGIMFEEDPNDPTGPSVPQPIYVPYIPLQNPNRESSDYPAINPDDLISTGDEVEVDPDTVPEDWKQETTDPDGGSDSGSGSTGGPTNGSFSSSTNLQPGKFKLDLKTIFPFCIPFDLYAMLSALQADPSPPVFTMVIPTPWGVNYEFVVDLSAWNDVAAMLRTCQVALFCIGLTMATRKWIKW